LSRSGVTGGIDNTSDKVSTTIMPDASVWINDLSAMPAAGGITGLSGAVLAAAPRGNRVVCAGNRKFALACAA